jgi:hypothetical protein
MKPPERTLYIFFCFSNLKRNSPRCDSDNVTVEVEISQPLAEGT